MAKIFIDVGASDGGTLQRGLKRFPDFDSYYGFEPSPYFIPILLERFKDNPKVHIVDKGADIENKASVKLYLPALVDERPHYNASGSMFDTKYNISKEHFVLISTIDFPKFVVDNFNVNDYIVLKMNAEGIEYPIFEGMIRNKTMSYFKVVYCEFHCTKISYPEDKHKRVVRRIRRLGISFYNIRLL